MTPTEQEIAFFKEAKRIQELREPTMGDWFFTPGQASRPAGCVWCMGFQKSAVFKSDAWLPRPDQLWEMLEERGYRWDVGKLPDSYTATIWNDDVDDSIVECEGPTPSIALGKCLLEVLKEE